MEIRAFPKSDLQPLFAYWQTIGEKIPYFFPVSLEKWHACLLRDTLDGEPQFVTQKIYVAIENGAIIGFIQGVQSAYAWNEKGEKYPNNQIGIIRHFYYDERQVEVAEQLWSKIEPFINQFPQQYAFYHIFGMSCNAHHGKLHASLWHVEPYLLGKGFEAEHENVYYNLELQEHQTEQQRGLLVQQPNRRTNSQGYEIIADGKQIGGLGILFLDQVTEGRTDDTVYLTSLWIREEYRRQGWASQAMMVLANELHSRGYKYLHTDTASTNVAAQRLYESLGFVNLGRTRSYIVKEGQISIPGLPNKHWSRPRSARAQRRYHALSVGVAAKVLTRAAAQFYRCPGQERVEKVSEEQIRMLRSQRCPRGMPFPGRWVSGSPRRRNG